MEKDKLKVIPDAPGVYFMKNAEGKTIYIGKAKSLKKRVSSYFIKTKKDMKTEKLVSLIENVETIVTKSEVEALILEAELIKKHKPHYNIDLKDNKSFPFIKITDEQFPRVFKTRNAGKKGRYFGPFVNAGQLNSIVRMLERIFPLRTCNKKLPLAKQGTNKCLNYHIGKCLAPCDGLINEEGYAAMVEEVAMLLEGKTEELSVSMQQQMKAAAAELNFEKAKELRDRIEMLKNISVEQSVYSGAGENRDALGVYSEGGVQSAVVLNIRNGKLIGKRGFTFKSEAPLGETLNELMKQYYHGAKLEIDSVSIPMPVEDRDIMQQWLSGIAGREINIDCVKLEDDGIMRIAKENAKLIHVENTAKEAKSSGAQRLAELFKIKQTPLSVEGFDIAHLDGKYMKASMVRFENGLPRNSEYRTFNIKSVDYIDDPKAIAEAVFRRYSRMKEEGQELPSLILIDGGKTQLNAATDALKRAGIKKQKIVSLAKRNEELFLPNMKLPLILDRSDDGLRLLQRVRDEAHRFVNSSHGRARKKGLLSGITDVKGVGEASRKRLVSYFGSIEKVKEAGELKIAEVPGISRKQAKAVSEYFAKKKDELSGKTGDD